MKKGLFVGILSLLAITFSSCTSNEVKEISGTLIFKDKGSHVFNINAENIEATITIVGPNKEEQHVYENVPLYRTSDYSVTIEHADSGEYKMEVRNNLVVMYEASAKRMLADRRIDEIADNGYVRIDWKGLN